MELFSGLSKHHELKVDNWSSALEGLISERMTALVETTCKATCACGEENRIFEEVFTCKSCGLLLERGFDTGAEYRFFANEDRGADPCRIGPPQDHRLPESSLGTVILAGRGNSKTMYRIRKFHTWNSMPYKERSLLQVYERLNLIATNHGLGTSVLEDIKDMFMKIHELCDRRGLSRDAILASCLYIVLKQAKSPRKHTEIAEMFSITTTTFTKALKYCMEILTLAQMKKASASPQIEIKTESGTTHAADYIDVPLSKLPLPRHLRDSVASACVRVCQAAEEHNISVENVPPSLAAGVIAFVIFRQSDLSITIANIAEVCDISVATLQKCLRRLEASNEVLEPYIVSK